MTAAKEPAEIARLATSILETHHAYLREHMPRLGSALRRAPPRLRQAWAALQIFLEDHLMKEEQILFPHVLAMCGGEDGMLGGVLGPIPVMFEEHQTIERMVAELRACAEEAGEHRVALLALLDDLTIHARKEDEELFPAALRLARVRAGLPEEEAPVAVPPVPTSPARPVAPAVTARPASPAAPPERGILRRLAGRLLRRG